MVPLETNFLSIYCTDFYNIFRTGSPIGADYDLTFVLQSLKGVVMTINVGATSVKFAYPIFTRRTGIPKRIKISQRRSAR